MVKLGQANKARVHDHCDILLDIWTKVRVIAHWFHNN